MNPSKFLNVLIGVTGPIAAFTLAADPKSFAAAVLVFIAIALVFARYSEYRHGAVMDDVYESKHYDNLAQNAESIYLEGLYVMQTFGRKDDMVFAVLKPGTNQVVARGKSFAEAIHNAINALANDWPALTEEK